MMSDYDKNDSELTYYDSIEKAILHSALKEENEELSVPDDFLNHVDETFHIWNGEQYDTIFIGREQTMIRCRDSYSHA